MRKIYMKMSLVALTLLTMTACQEIDDVVDQTPTTNSDNIAKAGTVIGSYYANIKVNTYYNNNGNYYAHLYSESNSTELLQEAEYDYRSSGFKFNNLNPSTKYFYKVLFDIGSYHKESPLMSFTTLPGVSCGDVLYVDRSGGILPFQEKYNVKEIRCQFGTTNNDYSILNSYIYYIEGGWKIGAQIDAANYNRIYAAYPTESLERRKFWVNTSNGATVEYLYGNGSLDKETYKYNLSMYHATAKVEFNIDIDPNINLESVLINEMKLYANGVVPVSGYISMEDGKISSENYSNINLGNKITLVKGKPYHTTFYPLPASKEGDVTFYMHVNGASVLNEPINLSENKKWEAGKTYTYNIIYTPKELRITSVSVKDWNDMSGGDITIKH